MNRLKRKYFELWGDEAAQNYFLKVLFIAAFTLISIETIAIVALSLRKPILVAVGSSETKVLTYSPPTPDLLKSELDRYVKKYGETRYRFTPETIQDRINEAKKLVGEDFKKQFDSANAEQIKMIREKKISQSVYFSQNPEIDPEKLTAKIFMDRIFSIEGIRGTAPLTLLVQFQYGARTIDNPEGIYITGESLQNNQ